MLDSTNQLQASPVGSFPLRRDKLVSKFCDVVPSTVPGLNSVLEKVLAVINDLCCAPEQTEDVELVLREALANAIFHGNRAGPTKNVLVACFCECEAGGGLLLVVRDEGLGFDPASVSDPTSAQAVTYTHGRGIFLMRHFMDEVRFRGGGTEVELRKRGKPGCQLHRDDRRQPPTGSPA